MNQTLLYLRYGLALVVAGLAWKDYGLKGFFGAFVAFNIFWEAGEQAVITKHNFNQTAKWQRKK